jgi:hypothetical protein
MIARIEAHNRLNGFAFVIGEFALIGLVALAFAALYSARANVLLAAACLGITANSLVVIFLAIRSLTRGESGIGILRIDTKRAVREQVMREHPDLSSAWKICDRPISAHRDDPTPVAAATLASQTAPGQRLSSAECRDARLTQPHRAACASFSPSRACASDSRREPPPGRRRCRAARPTA